MLLDLLEVGNKLWLRGAQADHRQDSSGPSSGVTIPRVELFAAVNSVQLTRKFRESLKLTFKKVRYFLDSSAVLRMLKAESGEDQQICRSTSREVRLKATRKPSGFG